MDKKAVFFYHALLAPQVGKQLVWLVSFRNISDYIYN